MSNSCSSSSFKMKAPQISYLKLSPSTSMSPRNFYVIWGASCNHILLPSPATHFLLSCSNGLCFNGVCSAKLMGTAIAGWIESSLTTRKWESIWISSWEAAPVLVPKESEMCALPFAPLLNKTTVLGRPPPPNFPSLFELISFFLPTPLKCTHTCDLERERL